MKNSNWDSQKRESNLVKHGIDFSDLYDFFDDPNLVERIDSRRDYGEIRRQALGHSQGHVLFVVYTWREDTRRLISARRATREEREIYEARSATP